MPPVNPKTLSWNNPTTNTDGTPYNAATDNGGYTILVDGKQTLSGPLSFGTSFDLRTLAAFEALPAGSHTLQLEVVTKTGVASAPSAAITFLAVAIPNAPDSLLLA